MEDNGNSITDAMKMWGVFWFIVAAPYLIPVALLMLIIYYMGKATSRVFGKDVKNVELPDYKKKKKGE
ncbi:MAG: hypothetical protein WA909_04830 [Castellaniella sp.]|uniref:hypothetical protein n=1 Tax=Castellaniella sp. TaxID=1955812 RepID=UPI003C78BA35